MICLFATNGVEACFENISSKSMGILGNGYKFDSSVEAFLQKHISRGVVTVFAPFIRRYSKGGMKATGDATILLSSVKRALM